MYDIAIHHLGNNSRWKMRQVSMPDFKRDSRVANTLCSESICDSTPLFMSIGNNTDACALSHLGHRSEEE